MSKQSVLRIHGQDFIGSSSTCFQILELMQSLQPVDIVYDYCAEHPKNRTIYYAALLECTQTAVLNPTVHLNKDHAMQVRDEAIAARDIPEAAA